MVKQTQRHTGSCLESLHALLAGPGLNPEAHFPVTCSYPYRTHPPLMTTNLSSDFSAEAAATAAWRLMMNLLVWKKLIIILTVALMVKGTSRS